MRVRAMVTAVLVTAIVGFLAAPATALQGEPPLYDFACRGASQLPDAFADAGYAADCLHLYGISYGKNDGTFGEHDQLTRSQVASFLTRLIELTPVALSAPPRTFPDVNEAVVPNEQVRAEIESLAGSGIIAGFPDGTFGPGENLTVAQAATLLIRALAFISASIADAPYVVDQGSTTDNYVYAQGAYLLDVTATDIDGYTYAVEASDVTDRGLLADMLCQGLRGLVATLVVNNLAPNP